jgi:hypothetical protein
MKKTIDRITVGDLVKQLKGYPDDFEISFGSGNLEFYRLKQRGPKIVQIEFNQNTDMVPDWD